MSHPNHLDIFNHYYHSQFWATKDGHAGPNSAEEYTPILRNNLAQLLEKHKINSLVDAGCGDANLWHYIDHSKINYTGLECVPKLVAQNKIRFKNQLNMTFDYADIIYDPLPEADIILCRDVVHYLPNDLIFKLLLNIKRSKSRYILVTHNLFAPLSANDKTEVGIFRPVNLSLEPFNLGAPVDAIDEDEYGKQLALFSLDSL